MHLKTLYYSCLLPFNFFPIFLFYLVTAVAVLSTDLLMVTAGDAFQQGQHGERLTECKLSGVFQQGLP